MLEPAAFRLQSTSRRDRPSLTKPSANLSGTYVFSSLDRPPTLLTDPSFSPHAFALDVLESYLPNGLPNTTSTAAVLIGGTGGILRGEFGRATQEEATPSSVEPPHGLGERETFRSTSYVNADALLSALDDAELDIRKTRDKVLSDEMAARDALRSALRNSNHVRASATMDIDDAEETLAAVHEAGKQATRGLSTLMEPLRVLHHERADLVRALDLMNLLSKGKKFGITRAAELLAAARACINDLESSNGFYPGTNHGFHALTNSRSGEAAWTTHPFSSDTGSAEERIQFSSSRLLDEHAEILKLARASICIHVEDVCSLLRRTVARGAVSMDYPAVRSCVLAAKKLGPNVVQDMLDAAVQAIVAACNESSSTNGPRARDFAKDSHIQDFVSDEFIDSSKFSDLMGIETPDMTNVLHPLEAARDDVLALVKEFSSIVATAFPDQVSATLAVSSRLYEKRLIRRAEQILDEFKREASKRVAEVNAEKSIWGSSTEEQSSSIGSNDIGKAAKAGVKADLRETMRNALNSSRAYLDVLAAISELIFSAEHEIYDVCCTVGVNIDDIVLALDKMRTPLDARLASYFDMGKDLLVEELNALFTEIERIETNEFRICANERPVTNDEFNRYRVAYLQVAARTPQIVRLAVRLCDQALHRSVRLYIPRQQQDSNSMFHSVQSVHVDSIHTDGHTTSRWKTAVSMDEPRAMSARESVDDLLPISKINSRSVLSSKDKSRRERAQSVISGLCESTLEICADNLRVILQCASHLIPSSSSGLEAAEIWATGSSPLVSYCRAVYIIFDSAIILDQFLQARGAANKSIPVRRSQVLASGQLKHEKLEEIFDLKVRSELRKLLRAHLGPLSFMAQTGISSALSLMSSHLAAILDVDEVDVVYSTPSGIPTVESLGSPYGAWRSSGASQDVSAPFLVAASFVDEQLRGTRGTLEGTNLQFAIAEMAKISYNVVLSRWLRLKGPVTASGGAQMVTDGSAISQIFAGLSVDAGIESLPSFGSMFVCRAVELHRLLESEPLLRVDGKVVLELLEKRLDAQEPVVRNVCTTLRTAVSSHDVSQPSLDD